MAYHQIEKGLTFPAPKRPFGARASTGIQEHLRHIDPDDFHATEARHALADLASWNVRGEYPTYSSYGVNEQADGSPTSPTSFDPESFFESRHSVRNFHRERTVSEELVTRACRLAQSAPSVCNRQAARIHLFGGRKARQALCLQNGNRGFRESITNLAIITIDRRWFLRAEERNQRWIDGGIFASTFMWALHSLGVASCMLNWSVTNHETIALRSQLKLPKSEDVICMVAFGYPPDPFRVSRSRRLPPDSVVIRHGD